MLALIAATALAAPTRGTTSRQLAPALGVCWSCNHGSSKWWIFSSCDCDAGWEGKCCDMPSSCSEGMEPLCPWAKLQEKTSQCSAMSDTGPIRVGKAEDGLPTSMQGVFWLTEQGDSSALMSFAQSKDGNGLSAFTMTPSDGYQIKVRVGGDRVWSFHDKASSWELVKGLDLVYNFRMEDADGGVPSTAEDIAAAQIIPSTANFGFELDLPSVLNFRAVLAPEGSHSKYTDSVVWGRPSAIFGFEGGYYDLVQVIDGEGNKIEPAFGDWVKYCEDASQTGSTPGEFHYKEAA